MTLRLLLLTSALAAAAPDEDYEAPPVRRGDVTARLRARIGEPSDAWPVTLTLPVEGPFGLAVEPARLGDPVAAWEATRAEWCADEGDRVRWVQVLRMRQVKAGQRPLPDVSVRFRVGPAAEWDKAEWTDLLKDTRPGPSLEPLPEPPPGMGWRTWAAVGGGVALLAGLAWLTLRRRPPPPPPSPEQVALEALAALDVGAADFHDRLAGIVRRFVGARFGLPVEQKTTAELLAAASAVPELAPERLAALRDVLERCDVARFAGLAGAEEERRAALDLARQVVGEDANRLAPSRQAAPITD
jgi:hypothetical protein